MPWGDLCICTVVSNKSQITPALCSSFSINPPPFLSTPQTCSRPGPSSQALAPWKMLKVPPKPQGKRLSCPCRGPFCSHLSAVDMGDHESGRSFGSSQQCGLPLAGPAKGGTEFAHLERLALCPQCCWQGTEGERGQRKSGRAKVQHRADPHSSRKFLQDISPCRVTLKTPAL